jgi:hypothetical protein
MDDYPKFDEAAAAEEILVELRRRRQRLQLREARQGDSTGPEVIGEIEDLTTRITAQEAEVQRLETCAAIDKWSLAEAKYRELLAETWSDAQGCPTVLGAERLERVRLELGVKPERAQALEVDIRVKLAIEVVRAINPAYIYDLFGRDLTNTTSTNALRQIGRSIRLDPATAAAFFCRGDMVAQWQHLGLYGLRELLLHAHPQWTDSTEAPLFQAFLRHIADAVEVLPCRPPIIPALCARPSIWNS